MKEDMIREYCTDFSRTLKDISEDISKRYNMKVSGSTIRKYARQKFGKEISRRDRSAREAYERLERLDEKNSINLKNFQ